MTQSTELPTGRRSFLADFLYFCAGADQRYIGDSNIERARYQSSGLAVLVTATLAAASMMYAVATFLHPPISICVGIGLFWGLAIFNLDRWIVSSVSYGNLSGNPDLRSAWSKIAAKLLYIPRILIAILIGFVIAEPLVLKIFDETIQRQLTILAVEKRKDIAAEVLEEREEHEDWKAARAKLTQLENEYDEIRRGVSSLDESVAAHVSQYEILIAQATRADEQYNAARSPENFYNQANKNGQVLAKQELVDKALADLNNRRLELGGDVTNPGLVAEASEELRAVEKRVDDELSAKAIEAAESDDGFLAREEALHSAIEEKPNLRWYRWAPAIVLLLVDCLPAFLKLLTGETPHDRQAQYDARIATMVAKLRYLDKEHEVLSYVPPPAAPRPAPPTTPGLPPPVEPPVPPGPVGTPSLEPSIGEGIFFPAARRVYVLVGEVGSGGSSKVFLAQPTGRVMPDEVARPTAIKIIHPDRLRKTEQKLMEMSAYSAHPNVQQLYGGVAQNGWLCLATPYMPNSSLDRFVFGLGELPKLSTVLHWLLDLVEASEWVWSRGYVHADGKPGNVLVDGPPRGAPPDVVEFFGSKTTRLVLTDFGESFQPDAWQLRDSIGFTPSYAPFEVIEWAMSGDEDSIPPHTWQTDVASLLGGVLHFLVSGGRAPFTSLPARGEAMSTENRRRIGIDELSAITPQPIAELCDRWLNDDPAGRVPSVEGSATPALIAAALKADVRWVAEALGTKELEQTVAGRHKSIAPMAPPIGLPEQYVAALRSY